MNNVIFINNHKSMCRTVNTIITISAIIVTLTACSKQDFGAASRAVKCNINAIMPEFSQNDFSGETKSSIESILRIRWDKGDRMSVINATTGKKLGGYIEALESGNQVKFEGKQLVGCINPGDKIIFINDSNSHSESETEYSSSLVDISEQAGELGSVPFCVYAEYTAIETNSISVDQLKFSFLTNYVQLAVSGLPQNGTIDNLSIDDINCKCRLSINEGHLVSSPEIGRLNLAQAFKLNSKGNQMRYFAAFKSEAQAEARKTYATYGDLVMTTSWVKAALDKGSYYQSIVTGFQSANFIKFADLSFKSFCVSNADANGDGEVSYLEAAAIEQFTTPNCPQNVKSADELSYFTSLKVCPKFGWCKTLSHIELPVSLQVIPEQAFCYCDNLTEIIIPENVSEIGYSAFLHCSKLLEIKFPDNVVSLGEGILSDCSSINSIVLPDAISKIPDKMFYRCTNLTEYVIPDGVKVIGNDAFGLCERLSEIDFPETLEEIGNYAFSGCKFTELKFPSSLKRIGEQAFCYNKSLTGVDLLSTIDYVGRYAFGSCENLVDLHIESAHTQICDEAFASTGIVEVTIPDGTTLLNSIFGDCKNLRTVNLPSTLKSIAKTQSALGLFSNCTNLQEICLPDGLQNIGDGSFNSSGIENITLPSSVRTLGISAFYNCQHLFEIELPENIQIIGSSAFGSCRNIKEITIPGAEIGTHSFRSCEGLNKVVIQEGTENIGFSAFQDCYNLYDISFPLTLKTIGDEAFANCIQIENITLPNNLETIGEKAFSNTRLKEIIIPDSVHRIGDENGYGNTFEYCSDLTKITIGTGCSYIGKEAFKGCTKLEEIHMKGTYPPAAINLEISEDVKIYVPTGSKQYYETADYWSSLLSQIYEE